MSGSFEANPPFCEELMESMVDHFEVSQSYHSNLVLELKIGEILRMNFSIVKVNGYTSRGNIFSLPPFKIQSTLVISTSVISNNRLYRRENLIPVLT